MTRRYGQWAGNEKGHAEDIERCVVSVWPRNGFIDAQCSRKRGYGLKGKYCKQHAGKKS